MAVNVEQWIQENSKDFLPPVCNKLLYGDGQLKVMFVGGPNIRKDFHIELGEEIFWQKKGHMCVRVMEFGKPKDVIIQEDEIFFLQSRIPHSPNRYENTVGLVVERDREPYEIDALCYFAESLPDFKENPQVLYQECFHVVDLGTQLKPVIARFFDSEEYKTGIPTKNSYRQTLDYPIDVTTPVNKPFSLTKWMEERKEQFEKGESVVMYGGKTYEDGRKDEFFVEVFGGKGEDVISETVSGRKETLLWQWKGSSVVHKVDTGEKIQVNEGDFFLANFSYRTSSPKGSIRIEISITPQRNIPSKP